MEDKPTDVGQCQNKEQFGWLDNSRTCAILIATKELNMPKMSEEETLDLLKSIEHQYEREQSFDDLECFIDDPETRTFYEPKYIIRQRVRRLIRELSS